jgi:thermitase
MPELHPNDPLYSEQWALRRIDAEAAWRRLSEVDCRPVTVAIPDWGVQQEHEDLAPERRAGFRVIPPGDDYSDDDGHGTMLAGIIGARRDNKTGVAGIIPDAKLLVIKFIDSHTPPTPDAAADAIRYAISNEAQLINASWHVSLDRDSLRDAIEQAGRRGILVVAGAGNNGTDNTRTPFFPACYEYDNLISVMASEEKDDRKAGFSNYGSNVHLAAPGRRILSTSIYRRAPISADVLRGEYNPAYRLYDGTSSAAAFVTSAAAMLLSIDDSWKPNEIRDHLIASADECPELYGLCQANGRLNLRRAVCGPFSIAAPNKGDHVKSGDKLEVKWSLDYDSPVVKTGEISINGLPIEREISAGAGCCVVELPRNPIPTAVLRVKCREKNLYAESEPFVIE